MGFDLRAIINATPLLLLCVCIEISALLISDRNTFNVYSILFYLYCCFLFSSLLLSHTHTHTYSRLVLLSCSTFILLALCVFFLLRNCTSVSFFLSNFCFCIFSIDVLLLLLLMLPLSYICYLFSDSFGSHFRIAGCQLCTYICCLIA